ncbi:MAG: hypothetical protein ACERKN_12080 [Velocimicrobium sp.]
MQNNNLPKNFFKDNPLDELSTAMLTHFRMITLTISELNNQVADVVVPAMEQSRLEQYQTEKENIMNLCKAEDIVLYMRKIKDPANSSLLLEKAIDYQDNIMPLVLKRISTSGHDVFIENTAILLANVDEKYTDQLYNLFPEIRNPYARSELCIVFGVKKKVEYTDLLLKQFKQIKEERPDKDYEQGPLLALNLIYGNV